MSISKDAKFVRCIDKGPYNELIEGKIYKIKDRKYSDSLKMNFTLVFNKGHKRSEDVGYSEYRFEEVTGEVVECVEGAEYQQYSHKVGDFFEVLLNEKNKNSLILLKGLNCWVNASRFRTVQEAKNPDQKTVEETKVELEKPYGYPPPIIKTRVPEIYEEKKKEIAACLEAIGYRPLLTIPNKMEIHPASQLSESDMAEIDELLKSTKETIGIPITPTLGWFYMIDRVKSVLGWSFKMGLIGTAFYGIAIVAVINQIITIEDIQAVADRLQAQYVSLRDSTVETVANNWLSATGITGGLITFLRFAWAFARRNIGTVLDAAALLISNLSKRADEISNRK